MLQIPELNTLNVSNNLAHLEIIPAIQNLPTKKKNSMMITPSEKLKKNSKHVSSTPSIH